MYKQITNILVATLASVAMADESTTTANVILSDGSSIKGNPTFETFDGDTLFANGIRLPVAAVKSITFKTDKSDGKVTLTNGDVFAFTTITESFPLNTALGELAISAKSIRSVTLQNIRTASAGAEGLLCHVTFEEPESINGKVNNAKFVEGKVGQALYVQRGLSACEIELQAETLGRKGCIEFWAAMIDGKTEFTTGGDPQFFKLFAANGRMLGGMGYASNDGMGNGGICALLPFGHTYSSRGFNQMMPYSKIFHGKPYEGWHHYALIWNYDGLVLPEANGRQIAILIDGKIATPYDHVGNPEESLKDFDLITMLAIPMKYDDPSYVNKSSFLLDELKIWNYDKTPEVED